MKRFRPISSRLAKKPCSLVFQQPKIKTTKNNNIQAALAFLPLSAESVTIQNHDEKKIENILV
jgi:hypothetical protein